MITASSGLSRISSSVAPIKSKAALQREVDALEYRRAELEQRDRLTWNELGSLHQDLHRGGSDAHAHAAAWH